MKRRRKCVLLGKIQFSPALGPRPGDKPVLAYPWAKARDLFIVHLLPPPKIFEMMMRMCLCS